MENNNSENENLIWVAPQIITVKPEQTEAGNYTVGFSEGIHTFDSRVYAS